MYPQRPRLPVLKFLPSPFVSSFVEKQVETVMVAEKGDDEHLLSR